MYKRLDEVMRLPRRYEALKRFSTPRNDRRVGRDRFVGEDASSHIEGSTVLNPYDLSNVALNNIVGAQHCCALLTLL
jgi:hypothetical protein